MKNSSTILVGVIDRQVWVRVGDRGSFQNSSQLKEFAQEMLNRGYRDFYVDLRECNSMDSTFMGTLTGIALKLRNFGQGGLHVVNLSEHNRNLLENLGLDSVMHLQSEADAREKDLPPEEALAATPEDEKESTAETMLEAHEALGEVDSENKDRFKDVLQFLREDLHRSRAS